MSQVPIYTTEPMVTRALAAEIRHAPETFVRLLAKRSGATEIKGTPAVRCEGVELTDVELTFPAGANSFVVGIEAKLDHALTQGQIVRQLAALDHVIVLLPSELDVPEWVSTTERLSVLTWGEALGCFGGSRLTLADISSIPLQKRQVERVLQGIPLVTRPLDSWFTAVERNGAGMPAVLMTSPELPNGREIRAQVQVVGRRLAADVSKTRIEYFLGISVKDNEADFPDSSVVDHEPGWITSLKTLRDVLASDGGDTFRIDQRRPGAGKSLNGKRKLALINRHAPESTWIAKGYRDWALGVKSQKVALNQAAEISSLLGELASRWFVKELERQQGLVADRN